MTWESSLESAQKTAVLQDGRRKVHYTFNDGNEMVEEYDSKTDELLLRKWRKKGTFGNAKPWEIEVGEPQQVAAHLASESGLIESSNNPVFIQRHPQGCFQFRIRNLTYPIDVYNITIEGRMIVVRTTNKKYFKKIPLLDLDRLGLEVDPTALTYTHANNTLIITYKKPQSLLEFEQRLLKRVKKLKNDGDVDQCKQQ